MIVRDDDCLKFVANKMDMEDHVIGEYINTTHKNFFGDNDEFFFCVAFEDGYSFIYFAWHDGTHKARKNLYRRALSFVRFSTNPVLYTTTQENLHSNHNRHIRDSLYELIV